MAAFVDLTAEASGSDVESTAESFDQLSVHGEPRPERRQRRRSRSSSCSDDHADSPRSGDSDGARARRDEVESPGAVASDSEPEGAVELERKDGAPFRFQRESVFLTYPRCPAPKEALRDFVNSQCNVRAYAIGRERHSDGAYHLHAVFKFSSRLRVRDCRFFDLVYEGVRYHPNIRGIGKTKRGGSALQRTVEYCIKEGDYIGEHINFWKSSANFTKNKGDFDNWVAFNERRALREIPWPIALPFSSARRIVPSPLPCPPCTLTRPDARNKQRHYWLYGPPDWGKSKWLNEAFAGCKVYLRGTSRAKYPFDDYNGEQVIIYDDVKPKFQEILSVSGLWSVPAMVYGDTRYKCRFWPMHKPDDPYSGVRIIIVLSNDAPAYGKAAFDARFHVVNLEEFIPYA